MSKVVMHNVVSVDGFIADDRDAVIQGTRVLHLRNRVSP